MLLRSPRSAAGLRSRGAARARLPAGHRGALMPRSSAPTDVFVLDFDGVVVDSEPEVSTSGLSAAAKYWPDVFSNVSAEKQAQLKQNLRKVRPVLVSGYECMILARMLLEDPMRADAILKDWENLLPKMTAEYQLDVPAVKKFFEDHRNALMNSDDGSVWLSMNQPYEGMREALQQCPHPFYIASSKAGHRIARVTQETLGLDIPEDSPRMFSSLLPPNEAKIATLKTIEQRPVCQAPGVRLHFVDDRFETLKAMVDDGGLPRWNLYHAAWGYATEAEVAKARATSGIRVIQLRDFEELLKWGILMGVDDGCEPTADEVAANMD